MNETITSKKKVALENGGFVYVKQKDRRVRGIVVGWTYRCQKHGNCNVRCHVERDTATNSYIRTKKFNYPHYHLAEPTAAANMKVSHLTVSRNLRSQATKGEGHNPVCFLKETCIVPFPLFCVYLAITTTSQSFPDRHFY